MNLFSSYYIGGFECSTHPTRDGRRLDLISSTRHDRFALQDYERLKSVGIHTARDGIRWHLIESANGNYDWSTVLPLLRAARQANVQVIWDLLHFGWPDFVDVFSPVFVDRFARFSGAFARLLRDEGIEVPFLCPVNEISFVSFAGGDAGFFPPFANGRGGELKIQLVRAALASIQAVRQVLPAARVVHTDPIINILPETEDYSVIFDAEGHRQAQYESWDMICGRRLPQLGGRPEYLDILGLNYYPYNQWFLPGHTERLIGPTHASYRPLWQMLREVHERYNRPLFIAETGVEDEGRPEWLRYVSQQCRLAQEAGAPVHGICLYPIVNHPGWDDDRHCHNGLWDYADAEGHRPIYQPLAHELAHQQNLLSAPATRVLEPLISGAELERTDSTAHLLADALEQERHTVE